MHPFISSKGCHTSTKSTNWYCNTNIADMLSRLAGKDLDPPDKVIPISFNAMQSSQPRRCLPRIKKQAIQIPYPAGKIDRILSSYQPQVLLKRLPEVLNKNTHISKIDTYLKADQPKTKGYCAKTKNNISKQQL